MVVNGVKPLIDSLIGPGIDHERPTGVHHLLARPHDEETT